jgi:hypothetical protein
VVTQLDEVNLEVAETVDMRLEEPVPSKVKVEAAGHPGVRLKLRATDCYRLSLSLLQ